MAREVFIVGAARTPIGSFQGALGAVDAPTLGSVAIRAALERAGVTGEQVDETYMGNVLTAGVGQAPARQAAKAAGVPDKTPATTVGKVCGSGLMSVVLGTKSIRLEDGEIVVAGGMESMTNAPYLLPQARAGFRMGNGSVVDSMVHDGLWDPYGNFHMGNAGELCARELGFSREAQDEFAKASYERALAAQKEGKLAKEIAAVTVKGRKGDVVVDSDEEPGRGDFSKMPGLRPAFQKDGTITAANASKINDGGAALILASEDAVKKHGLTPRARIVGYAGHAQAPEWFTTAPVGAIEKTLARLKLGVDDIDLWEVNEAFSVVSMACITKANVPHEKMNVWGGAVALGHPIGCSGARILVTLLHALEDRNAKRGLATLCIGGGEAVAVVIERV
ncbi:MAG: thiolase family protein [Sandaracinus sp.]|nr:thiolase family protein [Sandaracinus sp.]MCB9619031.1 thiolase family protein [Sandaracinus sp.]MCB9633035.1 thiolase family protein [Sandaracinus sp.]